MAFLMPDSTRATCISLITYSRMSKDTSGASLRLKAGSIMTLGTGSPSSVGGGGSPAKVELLFDRCFDVVTHAVPIRYFSVKK